MSDGLTNLREYSRQQLQVGTPPKYLFNETGKPQDEALVKLSIQLRMVEALERANEQKAGFTAAQYNSGSNHFHLAQLKGSRLVEMQVLGSTPEMARTISSGIHDFLKLCFQRDKLQIERAEVYRKLTASESDLCFLMYVDETATAEEAEELFCQISLLKERLADIDQELAPPDVETLRQERNKAKALLSEISDENLKVLGKSIDLNAQMDALRWEFINTLESIARIPVEQFTGDYKQYLRDVAGRLRRNEKGGPVDA